MQNRRHFLNQLCVGSVFFSIPFAALDCSRVKKRPNVILIITDDQGYGDFGVMGNPVIQTPHLDAMAKRSAQMINFYVCPVCAPTRASLLTGRYHYRTRVVDTFVGRAMMDPGEITLAELLKDAGYATGIFGKWHLGDNYPMRPQDQGFDEVLVHRGGGIGQPSDPPGGEGKYTDPILFHNGESEQKHGFCTDIYFKSALNWMEKQVQKDKSFFVYLPTNAPHSPFSDVPLEWYEKYKKINLASDQFPQEAGHPLPERQDQDAVARIYAMISNIDENISRLFTALKKLGQFENTLVIFMVDNGPNTRRYVAGMNGMKSNIYEGGIRSPLFMHWPGILKAGHVNDRISAHIDILPTILQACGLTPSPNLELDGQSLWPLLTDQKTDWPDRHIVIQAHRGDHPVRYHNFMLRTQKWKLLHNSGFGRETFEGIPQFELYDMENDPFEMKNVASQHPNLVSLFIARYDEWFENVSSTRTDNYAPPRIYIGSPHENPVVLTRQDWRHIKGQKWAMNSNGFWSLTVATDAFYNLYIRFKDNPGDGTIELKIAGQTFRSHFAVNQQDFVFENIALSKGDVELLVTLDFGDDERGPWQVEVLKKHNMRAS
jgi:arylsulfatase A-like enzyme